MIESSPKNADRSRILRESNLRSKESDNVNEEYKEAFRSKSYIEMWRKAQRQLGKRSLEKLSSSSSSSSFSNLHHLSDFLLEPKQETLVKIMKGSKIHQLLVNYFELSFEACNVCESLLQSTLQTRANYRKIKRVIKISKRVPEFEDNQRGIEIIFKEMEGFSGLKNPLSNITPMKFGDFHDSNMDLLHKLTSKQKKIKKNSKLRKFGKRILGGSLVISHTVLVTCLLILAIHSVVGLVAAPGLVACFFSIYKKKMFGKRRLTDSSSSLIERLGEQFDIAAKGTFILINDFDTMSRLVWRVYDEIEHLKEVAEMCVRNGKIEVLKEVVKEFETHESIFLEQLEELEEHIYLCFHTINRSRRLVIEKIVGTQLDVET